MHIFIPSKALVGRCPNEIRDDDDIKYAIVVARSKLESTQLYVIDSCIIRKDTL